MAFKVRCPCGSTVGIPQVRGGAAVSCPGCGRSISVPQVAGRPGGPGPFRAGPLLAGLVALLLVTGGIGAVASVAAWKRFKAAFPTAAPPESEEQRRTAIREGFDSEKDPGDAAAREPEIRGVLERLVASMKANDGTRFAAQIHGARLWSEIAAQPGVSKSRSALQDRVEAAQVQKEMVDLCRSTPEVTRWQAVRVVRVRGMPDPEEAQAFAVVLQNAVRAKFRFWLARDEGSWKVFDWEILDEGSRLSRIFASVIRAKMQDGGSVDRSAAAAKAVVRSVERLNGGEAEEALREVAAAKATRPPDHLKGTLDLLEVNALVALGRNEEALGALEGILGRNRDLPVAWVSRGNALRALGRPAEAAEAYREYLALLGDDADVCLALGEVLEEDKKPAEAAEAYRKGFESDPEDAENLRSLARLLLERESRAEAGALFRELARRQPGRYFAAAGQLRRREAWPELLDLARERGARERDAQSLYDQGFALRRMGRAREAEAALLGARERVEEDARQPYEAELAYAAFALGKEKEALGWADQVERRPSGAGLGPYLRAWIHASAGRPEEAEKVLVPLLAAWYGFHEEVRDEAVFEAVRGRAAVKESLARAEAKADYEAEAEGFLDDEEWEGLLKLASERAKAAPGDVDAWSHQGTALEGLGRHAGAEKAFRAALEIAPEDRRAELRHDLGLVLCRLGRPAEAEELAEKLLAAEEGRSQGLYLRACARATAKREDAAAKDLAELLTRESWYSYSVESEALLQPLLKRADVQALLKKAKAELQR